MNCLLDSNDDLYFAGVDGGGVTFGVAVLGEVLKRVWQRNAMMLGCAMDPVNSICMRILTLQSIPHKVLYNLR